MPVSHDVDVLRHKLSQIPFRGSGCFFSSFYFPLFQNSDVGEHSSQRQLQTGLGILAEVIKYTKLLGRRLFEWSTSHGLPKRSRAPKKRSEIEEWFLLYHDCVARDRVGSWFHMTGR